MPALIKESSEKIADLLQSIDPSITEEELRNAVEDAGEMTPEQRREQLISFVLGTVSSKSTMTREEVIQFLEKRRCW
ncbi:MAG: hypothetical protein OXM03_05375 [Chloroflexota bacterium]|nr:hypothetical protein [Chloroflexota bacterium]MDE2840041.1 hypothetical protein [Chloroflexota bacterium]MDE2930308.1 hypothetical protein [Chloroflexota bacterium]